MTRRSSSVPMASRARFPPDPPGTPRAGSSTGSPRRDSSGATESFSPTAASESTCASSLNREPLNRAPSARAPERRLEVIAVHPRDVRDRDFLRTDGFALALVRAAAEAFGVVAVDHAGDARVALDLALRQLAE